MSTYSVVVTHYVDTAGRRLCGHRRDRGEGTTRWGSVSCQDCWDTRQRICPHDWQPRQGGKVCPTCGLWAAD